MNIYEFTLVNKTKLYIAAHDLNHARIKCNIDKDFIAQIVVYEYGVEWLDPKTINLDDYKPDDYIVVSINPNLPVEIFPVKHLEIEHFKNNEIKCYKTVIEFHENLSIDSHVKFEPIAMCPLKIIKTTLLDGERLCYDILPDNPKNNLRIFIFNWTDVVMREKYKFSTSDSHKFYGQTLKEALEHLKNPLPNIKYSQPLIEKIQKCDCYTFDSNWQRGINYEYDKNAQYIAWNWNIFKHQVDILLINDKSLHYDAVLRLPTINKIIIDYPAKG